MKAIELTLYSDDKKAQFVISGNALIMREDEGTDQEGTVIYGLTGHVTNNGIKVKETPKQIADLINGNQKESGWVKHTTDATPFESDQCVAVELNDGRFRVGVSTDFSWGKLNSRSDIAYYKIIERRTK